MTAQEATDRALSAGATTEQINSYVGKTFGGPIYRHNMIRALQMHPWLNTPDDWARLAGAMRRSPVA